MKCAISGKFLDEFSAITCRSLELVLNDVIKEKTTLTICFYLRKLWESTLNLKCSQHYFANVMLEDFHVLSCGHPTWAQEAQLTYISTDQGWFFIFCRKFEISVSLLNMYLKMFLRFDNAFLARGIAKNLSIWNSNHFSVSGLPVVRHRMWYFCRCKTVKSVWSKKGQNLCLHHGGF